jgi:hypothetical protein
MRHPSATAPRSPTASRKPFAAPAVLGLLVVLLSLPAPAATASGPPARAAVSVHAPAAHHGAFQLPSLAAPGREAAAVAALLQPLVLAALALLALASPREGPGRPPRSAAALPPRTRAPPAAA